MSYYPIPRINTPHSKRYHNFLLGLLHHASHPQNDPIRERHGDEYTEACAAEQLEAWRARKAFAESGKTYREICDHHPDIQTAWDDMARSRRNWRTPISRMSETVGASR